MSAAASHATIDPEVIASMLAALDAAGVQGLAESKLVAKGNGALRKQQLAVLDRLSRGGLACKHRHGKTSHWFAARHAPSVDTVLAALRTLAVPRGPVVWTVLELGRLLPTVQRSMVPEALEKLVASGEAWGLCSATGRGRYWVFSRALHVRGANPADGVGAASAIAGLHAAYGEWRRKAASSLMAISDMRDSTGLPLAEVHRALRMEAAAHRAELSEGDWSMASEDVRAAALVLHGQKFIRVRFVEKG